MADFYATAKIPPDKNASRYEWKQHARELLSMLNEAEAEIGRKDTVIDAMDEELAAANPARLAQVEEERDRLRALVPYIKHADEGCYGSFGECCCGLDALLIEAGLDPKDYDGYYHDEDED